MNALVLMGAAALLGLGPSEKSQPIFAPEHCAYQVLFPAPIAVREAPGVGDRPDVSAELLLQNTRFAAACIVAADAPAPNASMLAVIAGLANAIGVRDAAIRTAEDIGPGCGSVEGKLDNAAYRIEARICIAKGFTFIAEAIYRSDQRGPAVATFLKSMSHKTIAERGAQ